MLLPHSKAASLWYSLSVASSDLDMCSSSAWRGDEARLLCTGPKFNSRSEEIDLNVDSPLRYARWLRRCDLWFAGRPSGSAQGIFTSAIECFVRCGQKFLPLGSGCCPRSSTGHRRGKIDKEQRNVDDDEGRGGTRGVNADSPKNRIYK